MPQLAQRQKETAQKHQLYAFLILSGLSVLFWSLYNLEPSLLSVLIKDHVPLSWMVISYVFFATGELLVGPVGIAMTGELAPSGHEGTCMGFWQIMMGLSAVVSEHLSHLSIFSTTHEITSSHSYLQLFILVGAGGMLIGLVTMVCARPIKTLLVYGQKNKTLSKI